ncbi:MAG: Uma2 family endonuclease [Chloroflexota bacterium]
MLAAGILREGDRVELIEGELLEKPVQNSPHATSLGLVQDVLPQIFGPGFHVRTQSPLALSEYSEPEPDLAVVRGSRRTYAIEHPTAAVLVIEVSDTTLRYDRGRKASLYARAGIQDYWIVNLPERRIEVYREPRPVPEAEFGYGYTSHTIIPEDGAMAPLAAPKMSIKVADVLP